MSLTKEEAVRFFRDVFPHACDKYVHAVYATCDIYGWMYKPLGNLHLKDVVEIVLLAHQRKITFKISADFDGAILVICWRSDKSTLLTLEYLVNRCMELMAVKEVAR